MIKKELSEEKKREQEAAIALADPDRIYAFAVINNRAADIERLQEALVNTPKRNENVARVVTRFARDIIGADLEPLQQVLIECGCAKWCFVFAAQVRGASIEACYRGVLADEKESLAKAEAMREKYPNVLTKEVAAEIESGVSL